MESLDLFEIETQSHKGPRWPARLVGVAMTAFGGLLVYAAVSGLVDLGRDDAPRGLAFFFCHLLIDIFGLLGLFCISFGLSRLFSNQADWFRKMRRVVLVKLLLVGGGVWVLIIAAFLLGFR